MNHKFALIFCVLMTHRALAMDMNQDPDSSLLCDEQLPCDLGQTTYPNVDNPNQQPINNIFKPSENYCQITFPAALIATTPASDQPSWNLTPLNNTDPHAIQFVGPENALQPSSEFWNNLDQIFANTFTTGTPIIHAPVSDQIPLPISNQPPANQLPNPNLVTNKVTTNNAPRTIRKDLYPKKCPVCAISLYLHNVTVHMREQHTTITQCAKGVIFTCNLCNKELIDQYYLHDHMTRCTRYPICPHCKLHLFRNKLAGHICVKKSLQSARVSNDN